MASRLEAIALKLEAIVLRPTLVAIEGKHSSHALSNGPTRPRSFSGLQAGDTDLLQRLARRRAASGG